jgi:dTDP-4-amino-4,6-dideoxygalactose transaminase
VIEDRLKKHIPMLNLQLEYEYMKEEIDASIQRCLNHQKWILGPEVEEFESNVARYLGVKHCVGLSSGTEALLLSLRALAIKLKGAEHFSAGDEIITTPFTFTATGDTILRAGATPVFVDIDPVSFNIDPLQVRGYLSANQPISRSARVKGILPVHLYGGPCEMDKITVMAKEYGLFVVEDAAQAFGAGYKGRKLGCFGDAGAFSFFPSKNLGGFGDAGMAATDDDGLADLMRMLLRHGGKDKYNVDHLGYNARIDTLQAAILLAKLKYLDELNERRRKIAGFYTHELAGINGLLLPFSQSANQPISQSAAPDAEGHVFHQYTLRVLEGRRDRLQAFLKERGIDSMIYYPFCLHGMKVFAGRSRIHGKLEHAERAVKEVLSLPMEPLYGDEEIGTIVEAIQAFFA